MGLRPRGYTQGMGRQRPAEVQPWMLFAFPLAIAVPITVAILLGGPMLGFPVAALVAIVLVGVAIRMQPGGQRAGTPEDVGVRPAAAARRLIVPAVIVVAGTVVAAATSGTASIIGWGVVAVGLVLAVSLVFLEIGYSEDRARAAEQRRRPRSRPPREGA
jgi:hypothetical protein